MSISAIDPACPRAILAMSVMLPSEMLCVTNISSINCNNTLFSLELNGEHVGESYISLRLITFEICACEFEKLTNSQKFYLWSLITGSNISLGSKTSPPIASTRREQSAVVVVVVFFFLLSSKTLSVQTLGESSPPPTLAKVAEYGKRARVKILGIW